MGLSIGLKAVFDGLVFALDAKNPKIYTDIPGITDHGISDWYCFISGTATYSAIYPNTEIIEINENGNETVMVSTGSDPQRGTFSTTAGRRYYGTKAIHILEEGVQDAIAPVSFAGTYFGNIHIRNDPKIVNIYAPQDDITVNVYQSYNYSGGVTGTPVSTFTVSKGVSDTYTFYGAYQIVLSTGGTGDYQVGETVEYEHTAIGGSTFTATAEVVSWDNSNRILIVTNISDGYGNGNPTSGTSIVGQTSNATWNFSSKTFNAYIFLSTDKPAIMTVGSGDDEHIMQPMTNYVYKRRNDINLTINDTAPSNSATYVSYDTSLPLLTLESGDGAGSDSAQGIGYEYLSDTFSWGNVLSDYQIVAPYADTTVTVSYWANSQWNVGEVHSLNGTQTNPDAVDRDGTNGFGVDGTNRSGHAANLASGANLWKWESTKPIALIINDNADDEENMLGWMSNKYERTSSNVTQSLINFINKNDKIFPKFYGKSLTTTNQYAESKLTPFNYFEFDGVDDRIIVQHKEWQNLDSWSVSMWINPNIIFDAESILFEKGGDLGYQLSLSTSGNLIFKDRGITNVISTTNDPVSILQWYNVVVTASPAGLQLYLNTNLEVSNTTAFGGNTSQNVLCIGGKQNISVLEKYFNGNIACFSFYSSVLTEQEIVSNYNALRPRFIPTGSDPLQAISGDIMTENNSILLTENNEVLILP
jgi:hypothetical protein